MAKPFQVTISPAIASATAFGNDLTSVNNVFTPTTSTTSDGLAHTILITNNSVTDLSGRTLTIIGTNFNGDSQTESITGPAASSTVSSSNYYLSLTSITVSGASIGSISFDLGINADARTPPYPIDWAKNQLEVNVSTEIEGYSLQYSRSPDYFSTLETSIQNIPSDEWIWVDWVASTSGVYQLLYAPVRIRFNFTEFTNGQTLTFCASQSRLT